MHLFRGENSVLRIRWFGCASSTLYTQAMSEQEPDQPTPPQGKTFQIMLVQTAVFAAVFFTIIWLIEDHSAIAAVLGVAAIAYMIARKKAG